MASRGNAYSNVLIHIIRILMTPSGEDVSLLAHLHSLLTQSITLAEQFANGAGGASPLGLGLVFRHVPMTGLPSI